MASENSRGESRKLDDWQRQRPDLDPVLRQTRAMLLSLGSYLLRDNDMIAREHHISGAEMRILFALRRSGKPFSLRPTDLLNGLLVPSATMTRQVDRLETLKFVTRLPDPADRRGYLVRLNASGIRVADKALTKAVKDSAVSSAIMHLPEEKRTSLWKSLHDIVMQLEAEETRKK